MSRLYNKKYKKGKFNKRAPLYGKGFTKSQLADYSKTRNVTEDYNKWASDPRKYDFAGIDTREEADKLQVFKYRSKSLPILGKKAGRENKTHRRYYFPKGKSKKTYKRNYSRYG